MNADHRENSQKALRSDSEFPKEGKPATEGKAVKLHFLGLIDPNEGKNTHSKNRHDSLFPDRKTEKRMYFSGE